MRCLKLISLAVILTLSAGAHELQSNRATLVLRDGTHVSVTLFIDYADALHLALAPESSLQEFLGVYSAMEAEAFERQAQRAQAKFEAATRLYVSRDVPIALTKWSWPEPKQVQRSLQVRLMQSLVDPHGAAHQEPFEIHADAVATRDIESVQVQFPDEFRMVLVVAFRPSQLWVEPKHLSPAIKF